MIVNLQSSPGGKIVVTGLPCQTAQLVLQSCIDSLDCAYDVQYLVTEDLATLNDLFWLHGPFCWMHNVTLQAHYIYRVLMISAMTISELKAKATGKCHKDGGEKFTLC